MDKISAQNINILILNSARVTIIARLTRRATRPRIRADDTLNRTVLKFCFFFVLVFPFLPFFFSCLKAALGELSCGVNYTDQENEPASTTASYLLTGGCESGIKTLLEAAYGSTAGGSSTPMFRCACTFSLSLSLGALCAILG